MRIRPVDERDVSIEDDHPVFRVHLWSPTAPAAQVPPERIGWWNDSYELRECDVHDAIAWAQDNVPEDGRYVLQACHRREDGRLAAIVLAGREPTRPDP
ncbi:hypothetical protein [Saccharopolyspora tripterygii]